MRRSRWQRFRLARRGSASIEFVLVIPILITMAFTFAELVRYIRIRSEFNVATATMADLVAAQQGVLAGTGGSLQDLCQGARDVMLPYPTTTLGISVASYTNPIGGTGVRTDWEYDSSCPTTVAMNASAAASPESTLVVNAGDSTIAVYAVYTYSPLISHFLPSITFHNFMTSRPRFGSVVCTNC